MTASTHRKIRKNNRFWVTKINKKGKQPLVAPVVEEGPVLMASTTVGTQANSSDFIFYKGGQSKNTRMSFIIDTTKNPDNNADKTIIIPFTLYTPSYQFTINWGDGTSTTYPANSALTTVGLTHTYSTAGQYIIVITSDKQKIPVLNWSTSGNVGGNKHKLIQLSTPLITFDTACPNSNSAQYFAYECDNLLFIATQFFINNPQIRNYDYCFSKCSKLVKIPYDLFKYVKYQSSYQEVFAHDISLQTVPNDLFATAKAIDLGGAFSGDSNLVLDVDLDTFFGTEPYINVDVHDIFRDCVKTTGDAVEFTKKFTEYVAYVIGTGTFDTGWGTLTGKIYAQPIYNSDGKLVRDLVPAKTGNFYGGRIAPQDCLYDEVNGEFLLPTSPFVYGVEVDDNYVIKDGNIEFVNPDIYLESTGTQKIDTGITRTTSKVWRFVGKFNYTDTTTRQLNGAQGFVYIGVINNHLQINNPISSYEDVSIVSGEDCTFDVTFDCPHNLLSYIVNGTTRNNKSTSYSDNPLGAHFYLFSLNDDVLPSKCKISYWKFFENGTLIRHFIPVPSGLKIGNYTVPSNGMWDTVTKTFFENKGTGSFTIGGLTTDTERENNLPYSFKKNALYNCEKWSNFAIPESVWTGTPSNRDNWLAVNEGKTNWLLTDSMNMLLLESANSSILCSPTDALKADTEALLSWYTGTLPEQVQGIIKPEPYESVDSLRNIINALPELGGYTVVGNPTIVDGVASGFSGYPDSASIIKTSKKLDTSLPFEINVEFKRNSTTPGCVVSTNGGELCQPQGNNIIRIKLKNYANTAEIYASYDATLINWENNVTYIFNLVYSNNSFLYTIKRKSDNALVYTKTISSEEKMYLGTFYFGGILVSAYTHLDGSIDLNHTYIKVNNKVWFDGTEKLNEVVDLSGCINKGGLTSADLQKIIDKGYTLLLN